MSYSDFTTVRITRNNTLVNSLERTASHGFLYLGAQAHAFLNSNECNA